jgi:hypothetical protein
VAAAEKEKWPIHQRQEGEEEEESVAIQRIFTLLNTLIAKI